MAIQPQEVGAGFIALGGGLIAASFSPHGLNLIPGADGFNGTVVAAAGVGSVGLGFAMSVADFGGKSK